METEWTLHHSQMTYDQLGWIPHIIRADDPRPVAEQVDDRYRHGGGWLPYGEGKWQRDIATGALRYGSEDEPLPVLASLRVGEEMVYFYPYALVCVVQPDGSFEVSRMD